jgi:hypothetical protein
MQSRPQQNLTSPIVLDRAFFNSQARFWQGLAHQSKLPEFVRRSENLGELWSFIEAKHKPLPTLSSSAAAATIARRLSLLQTIGHITFVEVFEQPAIASRRADSAFSEFVTTCIPSETAAPHARTN